MSDREYIISMYCKTRGVKCEEIVRCRDCKHSDKGYWCRYFGKYGDLSTVEPDGFCAWGERKVVGE